MKKSLMVIVAFVLILTHIIPPLNISFANDEVNEYENMDFTVQTIKENDEKIVGTGMVSDQLTVEFKTKNKTETVNIEVNGKLELKVDEEFLEINDVILISNDYFKIETKIASKESSSNSLQSKQYIECPVSEEEIEETVTEAEGTLEESAVDESSEEAAEKEEEPSVVDESSEEAAEKEEEPSVVDESSEEGTEKEEGPLAVDEFLEKESKLNNNELLDMRFGILSLLGLEVFKNNHLAVEHHINNNGKHEITLTSKPSGLIDVNLLDVKYLNFYLPPELMGEGIIDSYSGTYLRTRPLIPDKVKEFDENDIESDGNHFYMLGEESLVSIGVGKITYTLTLILNDLPEMKNGELFFQSTMSSNDIIRLDLLTDKVGSATLHVLNKPKIKSPVFSTDEVITGTGQPNSKIIITIEGKEYTGDVNDAGDFIINIEPQSPGTIISAQLIGSNESKSGIEETTLQAATLSFGNIPSVITFENTLITNTLNDIKIPRQKSDWALDVIDTRGSGSEFKVLAEAVDPLSNEDGSQTLPNGLVYVDENNQSHSLYGESFKVYSGTTGDNHISEISWPENRGIMVEVNPLLVKPESYSTTINWTLSNGP